MIPQEFEERMEGSAPKWVVAVLAWTGLRLPC